MPLALVVLAGPGRLGGASSAGGSCSFRCSYAPQKEQANMCGQIESNLQGCQRQLEAKKKIQADMEKELQAAFSEITELNALLNSKVPKGTDSSHV